MKRQLMHIIVTLLLALSAEHATSAEARQLHTLDLQHTLPEQLISALQPQISAGSSLTAWQQKIIANVTDAEYRQLLLLLPELDVAGRELIIHVRSRQPQQSNAYALTSSGRINSGKLTVGSTPANTNSNTTIIYNPDGTVTETRIRTSGAAQQRTTNTEREHSLRISEGLAAFINTGERTPFTYYEPGYGSQTQFIDSERGFYVTAYPLDEQRVKLVIDHRHQQREGDTVTGQTLSSTIVATTGQWLPVGSIQDNTDVHEQSIGSNRNATSRESYHVYLMVEYP